VEEVRVAVRAGLFVSGTTHEAAMDFASGDVAVEHGTVNAWQVRDRGELILTGRCRAYAVVVTA
jgi:hypothetical protein